MLSRSAAGRALATLTADFRRIVSSVSTAAIAILLSVLIQATFSLATYVLAASLALDLGVLDCLVLIPSVVLVMALPISIAGWGVRESALMLAFGYAGLSQSDGLVVSILFGAAYFAVGIAGGAVWLFGSRGVPLSALRQAEPPASAAAHDRR